MTDPARVPVIVGIGELLDRPEKLSQARDPLDLMKAALESADGDAGAHLLSSLDSLDVVGQISWRYEDPAAQLCERLALSPARTSNSRVSGEIPVRLVHEAALRIAAGESQVAAIVGAEAAYSVNRARKQGEKLPWPKPASRDTAVDVVPKTSAESHPVIKQLRLTDAAHVYPLFEMAAQHTWGQTPAEAHYESAALWESYSRVAAENPMAWSQQALAARDIASATDQNRLICWPYTKRMVANPLVNQGAAVILTSLDRAQKAGIPESHYVYIWGGAAAQDPDNYLLRERFDDSPAQTAVLRQAMAIGGDSVENFRHWELYSCFPIVPKMAMRQLGLARASTLPTVTGGLSYFGGPLSNYMTHSICAMARRLRDAPDDLGLLYGQGGYLCKHHSLVLSGRPNEGALPETYCVQECSDADSGPAPAFHDELTGPASIETYTVVFARDGEPLHGIVVGRTPADKRVLARVAADDEASMSALLSTERSAIGCAGQVSLDVYGIPVWQLGGTVRKRNKRFTRVERDRPVTVVTIDCEASRNALQPGANEELAEIFDDFANDPTQWVAILTGAGDKAFCAGNDLKYTARALARGETLKMPLSGFGGLAGRFDLNKPVIAAVNGIAFGGGFELALACDLIIAADGARFALPEPKVGLAALEGGLLRLPREIGHKQAMSLILTGREVSAEEGQALGFVNAVTPLQELMATARHYAEQILACSPMAIQASKEAVRCGLDDSSLEQAYADRVKHPAIRRLFRSADFKEGPRAFAEKRAPQWQGR